MSNPDDLDGWDWGWQVSEGGDICMRRVDSLPCTAESNTAL